MEKPLNVQIGGSHYKKYEYQPVEFINDLDLGFIQGNIIKYVVRYKDKNGQEDIKKIIHYCQLAIELKTKGAASKLHVYNEQYAKFMMQLGLDELIGYVVRYTIAGKWGHIINVCNLKLKQNETNQI